VPEYIAAATRDEIPPGRSILRTVGNYAVLLCNVGGNFYAIENRCSHMQGPLEGGRLSGHIITCPFHFAQFDVRNGESKGFPAIRPIRCFDVRIDGSAVLVATTPIPPR
jgi:nitrite reductase/ring-hydroxylating ferredoxin subunit